ncbi:MAG: hypothetical protein U1G07_07865 [Verrucomicrobiota bacterium]
MKRKQVTLAVLLAALSLVAAPSARALTQADNLAIKTAVAKAPAAELAAHAAQIVAQANKEDRKDAALVTVREIVSKRPAVLLAAVAAMTKAAPDLGADIASEAAKLSPDQATDIAKAAATSAPSRADQIAAAVAKVTPKSASRIAQAVATVVPSQTANIVEMVLNAVPSASTEVSANSFLTRSSQRSASSPGTGGTITTRPGTIAGTPPPGTPPSEVGAPTTGSDPRRQYGSVGP